MHRRHTRFRAPSPRFGACAAALAAASFTLIGPASQGAVASGTTSPASPAGSVFTTSSAWKADLRGAPLASNSSSQVHNLAIQVSELYSGNAAFNVKTYNSTFYRVPATTTRHSVKWDDCMGLGFTPLTLYDPAHGAHFASVPIPSGAVASSGSDGELSIWSPSSDQLWDLWKAHKSWDGWHACWGGRIDHVSTSRGYFHSGMGSSATGLPYAGGMVGIHDVQSGAINHAVALQIRRAADFRVFSWPAQRSDGWNPKHLPNAIPEGTRFRLDSRVDVRSLHLHPVAAMIARAAQKYGFIVTDRSGVVAVSAENGAAVSRLTGINPWSSLLAGTPSYAVMHGFPWSRLQALPKDYGK